MPKSIQLVVMGVSGSGKSTLGVALERAIGGKFIDGDELHSPVSVEKMRAGIALEDADRWPWLDRVAAYLSAPQIGSANGESAARIVACSALKRAYRDRIRATATCVRFLFLHGDSALIQMRMQARENHFMNPALLKSQLETLELPSECETDVIWLDVKLSASELVETVVSTLDLSSSAVRTP